MEQIKLIYDDMSAPKQRTLQEVIAHFRKEFQNGSQQAKRQFLTKTFEDTILEFQSVDLQVKQIAAEKLLFLVNEGVFESQ